MSWLKRLVIFLLSGICCAAFSAERPEQLVCVCGVFRTSLFVANSDGSNERVLLESAASNYNASFSADGRWIVFTSDRAGSADIYRAHQDGSALERLTDAPSFDDQGALSPDDQTLAFVSTRGGGTAQVWLLNIGARRLRRLTKGPAASLRPAWSPDGKWLAFSSDRDTDAGRALPHWELLQLSAIYIVHPDGTGLRRLTPLDRFAGSPSWTADGKGILFHYASDIRGTHRVPTTAGSIPQIASVDVATGLITTLTDGDDWKLSPRDIAPGRPGYVQRDTHGEMQLMVLGDPAARVKSAQHPAWSPDGTSVIFQRVEMSFSWMRRTAGTDSRYALLQSPNTFSFPALSPDGKQVASPATDRTGSSIELMNLDGSNRRTLFAAPPSGPHIVSVTWRPDGRSLAFGLDGGTDSFIDSVSVSDPQQERALTAADSHASFPSFSPDGTKLVYRVNGAAAGLRIRSLVDGKITVLTSGPDNFPVWSPRGDQIVFTSQRTGDFEIFSIAANGAHLRQLTRDRGNDGHPIWSPDGRWIAYASSAKGWKDEGIFLGGQPYGEIFVMRANGSDQRQLTDNQYEDAAVLWLPRREVTATP